MLRCWSVEYQEVLPKIEVITIFIFYKHETCPELCIADSDSRNIVDDEVYCMTEPRFLCSL